jgi:purine-nucleoside phosphorylase
MDFALRPTISQARMRYCSSCFLYLSWSAPVHTGEFSNIASFTLLEKAKNGADQKGLPVHVGNVLTSDIFYNADPTAIEKWRKMGILSVEMETAGLYMNAAYAGVNALTILTVSDHIIRHEQTTPEERQIAFTNMMEIALGLA